MVEGWLWPLLLPLTFPSSALSSTSFTDAWKSGVMKSCTRLRPITSSLLKPAWVWRVERVEVRVWRWRVVRVVRVEGGGWRAWRVWRLTGDLRRLAVPLVDLAIGVDAKDGRVRRLDETFQVGSHL